MFDVPSIGDDSTVLVSHHERPLPRGRKLVPVLAALNSSEDQVPDLELASAHVALVVASQGLLILGRV
jgi:hypothetical protein